MATQTSMSKDEILDAIGNMSVFELAELIEAFKSKLTPEMPSAQELRSAVNRLVGGAYWTYEDEVVGAGGHYLQGRADGVIGIMAFGCGPDSLMLSKAKQIQNQRGD